MSKDRIEEYLYKDFDRIKKRYIITEEKLFQAKTQAYQWVKRRPSIFQTEYKRFSSKYWAFLLNDKSEEIIIFTPKKYKKDASMDAISVFIRKTIPIEKGFFLHCSSIYMNKKTLIFIGESGRGKTTIAEKAKKMNFFVLSDEIIFIEKGKTNFIAHGTPFGKVSDGYMSDKISSVFLLEQSNENKFRKMSPIQSFSRAWKDSYYRTQIVTVEERKVVFNNMFNMFSALPCYEMRFRKDFDDWDKLIDLCKSY